MTVQRRASLYFVVALAVACTVHAQISVSSLSSYPFMSPQFSYSTNVDLSTVLATSGYFAQPVNLGFSQGKYLFSCAKFPLYSPNTSTLHAIIQGFPVNPTYTCDPINTLGPGTTAKTCKWSQQNFLAMLYDRGVALMRQSVPQQDAFQPFLHARLVLQQYQLCGGVNPDGTVNVPMALENIYGMVFGLLFAKAAPAWTNPTVVDPSAVSYLTTLESGAISAPLGSTFSNATLLSPITLSDLQLGVFSPQLYNLGTSNALSGAVRSATNPTSTADCNMNNPGSPTWTYYVYPYTLVNPLQNCCATACLSLLSTINVSPTPLLLSTCCSACNAFNCKPADSTSSAAVALMTVIAVPSLLSGYVTTVNVTV